MEGDFNVNMINQSVKIIIQSNHKRVFDYVSDLRNDKFWRAEVESTFLEGPNGLGNIANEISFLSVRVPEYNQSLECVMYIPGREITYQTLPGNSHYLISKRQVKILSENVTEFSYNLAFNASLVKHGLGFSIPNFISQIVTKRSMKKYMKVLKNIMEAKMQ